ncbi:MAG: hypothetical protein ACJA0J_002643, partial [Bdellovibrionota bacterium]
FYLIRVPKGRKEDKWVFIRSQHCQFSHIAGIHKRKYAILQQFATRMPI